MEETRVLKRAGPVGFAMLLTLAAACTHREPATHKSASTLEALPAAAAPATKEPAAGSMAEPGPAALPVAATAEPARASLPPENAFAGRAREILRAAPCGQCHQPDLPTSVPAALAFYNLAEDPWYSRLKPENYDGLLRRVRGSGSIAAEDKAILESFVRCARDQECSAP